MNIFRYILILNCLMNNVKENICLATVMLLTPKGSVLLSSTFTLKDSIVIEHCSMSLIFIGSFQQSNSM